MPFTPKCEHVVLTSLSVTHTVMVTSKYILSAVEVYLIFFVAKTFSFSCIYFADLARQMLPGVM